MPTYYTLDIHTTGLNKAARALAREITGWSDEQLAQQLKHLPCRLHSELPLTDAISWQRDLERLGVDTSLEKVTREEPDHVSEPEETPDPPEEIVMTLGENYEFIPESETPESHWNRLHLLWLLLLLIPLFWWLWPAGTPDTPPRDSFAEKGEEISRDVSQRLESGSTHGVWTDTELNLLEKDILRLEAVLHSISHPGKKLMIQERIQRTHRFLDAERELMQLPEPLLDDIYRSRRLALADNRRLPDSLRLDPWLDREEKVEEYLARYIRLVRTLNHESTLIPGFADFTASCRNLAQWVPNSQLEQRLERVIQQPQVQRQLSLATERAQQTPDLYWVALPHSWLAVTDLCNGTELTAACDGRDTLLQVSEHLLQLPLTDEVPELRLGGKRLEAVKTRRPVYPGVHLQPDHLFNTLVTTAGSGEDELKRGHNHHWLVENEREQDNVLMRVLESAWLVLHLTGTPPDPVLVATEDALQYLPAASVVRYSFDRELGRREPLVKYYH